MAALVIRVCLQTGMSSRIAYGTGAEESSAEKGAFDRPARGSAGQSERCMSMRERQEIQVLLRPAPKIMRHELYRPGARRQGYSRCYWAWFVRRVPNNPSQALLAERDHPSGRSSITADWDSAPLPNADDPIGRSSGEALTVRAESDTVHSVARSAQG